MEFNIEFNSLEVDSKDSVSRNRKKKENNNMIPVLHSLALLICDTVCLNSFDR